MEIIQLGMRTNTEPPYFIDGILPRAGVVCVVGDRELRTAIIFDLMIHGALGLPYSGRAVSQGAVVYLDIEGGASIPNRVTGFYKGRERGVPFYLTPGPIDLATEVPTAIQTIRAAGIRPAVIVLDGPCERASVDAIRNAFSCLVVVSCLAADDERQSETHIAVRHNAAGDIVTTIELIGEQREWNEFICQTRIIGIGRDLDGGIVSTNLLTA